MLHDHPAPRRRLAVMALAGWLTFIAGIAVHGFFFPRAHTVFDIYAPAALRWWAGEEMYAPFVRSWTEDGKPASTTEHYRYCPLFAVGMTPFALLPYPVGNALWKAFNAAFFALGLWYAARRVFPFFSRAAHAVSGPDKPLTTCAAPCTQLAGFMLLALPVALHSMYNGQANLIVVAAVLFGFGAAATRQWNVAAGWLAVATLIKGYPLAAGLLLAALYPRPFALRYFVAVLAGLLAPFLAQRPGYVFEQTVAWCRHMGDSTTLMRERQRSIDFLLQAWGYPILPRMFAILGVVAAVCVLGICIVHARRNREIRSQLTCVLLLYSAWVALFGQATEACTYAIMAPAIAWATVDSFSRPGTWVARTVLISSLLMMGPLVTDMFGQAVRSFAVSRGSQPVGALLFLCYAIWIICRDCRFARRDSIQEGPATQPPANARVTSAA